MEIFLKEDFFPSYLSHVSTFSLVRYLAKKPSGSMPFLWDTFFFEDFMSSNFALLNASNTASAFWKINNILLLNKQETCSSFYPLTSALCCVSTSHLYCCHFVLLVLLLSVVVYSLTPAAFLTHPICCQLLLSTCCSFLSLLLSLFPLCCLLFFPLISATLPFLSPL